jgi:hypothetical protein
LAGNRGQVTNSRVHCLGILDNLTQPDIDDHFMDARDLHGILVVKLLPQGWHDVLLIFFFQP